MAGEWAYVWPLGRLIGGMGAFFVRRGSGDDLYRGVLERFVQMAVEGGLTQVIFPEGGLSRDGKPREPKIGLLDYMLRRFDPETCDILFVPIGVNYDWVLEDHNLLQPGGPQGSGGLFASTAGSVVRNLIQARRSGSFRLGGAAVGVGIPVSARQYAASRGVEFRRLEREDRIEEVKALARLLMQAINDAIPPVAVPLVALAVTEAPEGALPEDSLSLQARSLAQGDEPLPGRPTDTRDAANGSGRARLVQACAGRGEDPALLRQLRLSLRGGARRLIGKHIGGAEGLLEDLTAFGSAYKALVGSLVPADARLVPVAPEAAGLDRR